MTGDDLLSSKLGDRTDRVVEKEKNRGWRMMKVMLNQWMVDRRREKQIVKR